MERWLRITDNGHGEWSVLDVERDYRVCSFNDAAHGGVHIHHKKTVRKVSVSGLGDAAQIVRRYARKHDRFNLKDFEETVDRWNSEPSTD